MRVTIGLISMDSLFCQRDRTRDQNRDSGKLEQAEQVPHQGPDCKGPLFYLPTAGNSRVLRKQAQSASMCSTISCGFSTPRNSFTSSL